MNNTLKTVAEVIGCIVTLAALYFLCVGACLAFHSAKACHL